MNVKELQRLAFGESVRRVTEKNLSFTNANLYCNECRAEDVMIVKRDRWCAECGSSDLRVKTPEMLVKEECADLAKRAAESDSDIDRHIYHYAMGMAYKRLIDRKVRKSRKTEPAFA